jgi:hypothetical protein
VAVLLEGEAALCRLFVITQLEVQTRQQRRVNDLLVPAVPQVDGMFAKCDADSSGGPGAILAHRTNAGFGLRCVRAEPSAADQAQPVT